MKRRILLIDGHPDARAERFVHALAKSYCDGARAGGHEVKSIIVSELEFPVLRTAEEFADSAAAPAIWRAQQTIAWAEHVVILFPLWLGTMPALLKAFLEQVFRPKFAFRTDGRALPRKLLKGKSARIVVTMGMPALLYRVYFQAHGVAGLRLSILGFGGFAPIHTSLIGGVETMSSARRGLWLARMAQMGRRAR